MSATPTPQEIAVVQAGSDFGGRTMAVCRDCTHYDLDAHRNKGGRIVVRKDRGARCLFDMARLERKFPASTNKAGCNLVMGHMRPDDGSGYPQWTKRAADAIERGDHRSNDHG